MSGPYGHEPPPEGPASSEGDIDPGAPFHDEEPDSPGRRAGWLSRILLILLAMALVPWLVDECQDPDGRFPVREEAPPAPGGDTP